MLRKHGVVGKFVEFYGDGSIRCWRIGATIANMSPEYGATLWFLPIDAITEYMRLSGRSDDLVELAETYAKAQGMWRNPGDEPVFLPSKVRWNWIWADVEASLWPWGRNARVIAWR